MRRSWDGLRSQLSGDEREQGPPLGTWRDERQWKGRWQGLGHAGCPISGICEMACTGGQWAMSIGVASIGCRHWAGPCGWCHTGKAGWEMPVAMPETLPRGKTWFSYWTRDLSELLHRSGNGPVVRREVAIRRPLVDSCRWAHEQGTAMGRAKTQHPQRNGALSQNFAG